MIGRVARLVVGSFACWCGILLAAGSVYGMIAQPEVPRPFVLMIGWLGIIAAIYGGVVAGVAAYEDQKPK